MFVVLLLFLIELALGVAYPLYMTLRIIVGSDDTSKEFQTWSFYWVAFSILQTTLGACSWIPVRLFKVLAITFIANGRGSALVLGVLTQSAYPGSVSYTHLTLPTNREV